MFPVIRQSASPAMAASKNGSSVGSGSLAGNRVARHAESFRLDLLQQGLSQFEAELKLWSGENLVIFREDSGIEAQTQGA